MTHTPITDQQLNDIDTRAKAATPGPWTVSEDYSDVLGPDGDQLAGYCHTADGEFIAHAPEDVRTLLDEVRRLRALNAQLDRALGETIDDRDQLHEVADKLAYAVAPIEAIGEHSSMNCPWTNAFELITPKAEVDKLRGALEGIRHLHKDSPMGPCPVCIAADAAAAGGDGLVPYPCPTGRLAGAQDCDPPSLRTT